MHSTNLKFAILSLSLLLCSCRAGGSQPTASEQPTEADPSQSLAPIADAPVPLGKAKATCGDSLPKDEKAYPVRFHPVFVSYSEKNLAIVKKHFCADAIKRRSEKLSKDVVQVASFTSKEKANVLKSDLSAYLQGVDIGEPTVIQNNASSTRNAGEAAKPLPTSKAAINQLGTRAMLTSAQVESLLRSERENTVAGLRTIVPTYVPEGYRIETVEADWCGKFQKENNVKRANTFKIVYRKSSQQSFSVQNVLTCGDGGADLSMSGHLDIPSKKFEKVWLDYTDFDSLSKGPRIVGNITTAPDSQGSSRGLLMMEYSSPQLNVEEARKIMESMEHLNENR
jgi:hypothetical protein